MLLHLYMICVFASVQTLASSAEADRRSVGAARRSDAGLNLARPHVHPARSPVKHGSSTASRPIDAEQNLAKPCAESAQSSENNDKGPQGPTDLPTESLQNLFQNRYVLGDGVNDIVNTIFHLLAIAE